MLPNLDTPAGLLILAVRIVSQGRFGQSRDLRINPLTSKMDRIECAKGSPKVGDETMTTITEITELKAEMDAKFDKVFDQIAELHSEMNGRFEDVNKKLDKLLKFHGIEDDNG